MKDRGRYGGKRKRWSKLEEMEERGGERRKRWRWKNEEDMKERRRDVGK